MSITTADTTVPTPPQTITIFWCDACQRTTFTHPFTHYARGSRCKGTVHEIEYNKTEN